MLNNIGLGLEDVRAVLAGRQCECAQRAASADANQSWTISHHRSNLKAKRLRGPGGGLSQRRAGDACPMSPTVVDSVEDLRNVGFVER